VDRGVDAAGDRIVSHADKRGRAGDERYLCQRIEGLAGDGAMHLVDTCRPGLDCRFRRVAVGTAAGSRRFRGRGDRRVRCFAAGALHVFCP
jgi:hypothetical protein